MARTQGDTIHMRIEQASESSIAFQNTKSDKMNTKNLVYVHHIV